jgi:serpin B
MFESHLNKESEMRTMLILLTVLMFLGCTHMPAAEKEPQPDMTELVEANNEFSVNIYHELVEKQEGNLFVSPFSINTALAMTYAGARGETARQMREVLRYSLPDERIHPAFGQLLNDMNRRQKEAAYQLSVANALWGQKGYDFLDDYLRRTRRNYDAGLRQVDFKTSPERVRERINAWVADKTQGKIRNLMPEGSIKKLTRLVLTNAVYFKARWAKTFSESATRDEPFHLLDDETVDAPMMRQTSRFGYAETEGFKMLMLPYKKHDLSMVVLLPRTNDGLPQLEAKLSAERLHAILKRGSLTRVQVVLPKFKLATKVMLGNVLQEMGMTDAFDPRDADFSGMNGRRDLFIQTAVHKAYVDVYEAGTEAAAATGISVGVTAVMPEKPKVFRADHPFLFLIRDNRTGAILFIGRVLNPAE